MIRHCRRTPVRWRRFITLAASATIVYGLFCAAIVAPAYANFGPHGPIDSPDPATCAACHRLHTSLAPAEWQDSLGSLSSGLLVGSADNMTMFCYSCHGNGTPGASTNVEMGIFDGAPSMPTSSPAVHVYQTNSSFDATLNGGGFEYVPIDASGSVFAAVTSRHAMTEDPSVAAATPVWGFGSSISGTEPRATGALGRFTCTNCHDPHGSSNYRLLRDNLTVGGGGVPVGGYTADDLPTPYVVSNEEGYPRNGWAKGAQGLAEVSGYRPDYTSPQYAFTPPPKGLSGWCCGCHTNYSAEKSVYDFGAHLADRSYSGGSGIPVGAQTFHRHLVGVDLNAGPSGRGHLTVDPVVDRTLPLERPPGSGPVPAGSWTTSDRIGCLTCHRAHGTAVTMGGWAESELVLNPASAQSPGTGSETDTPAWTIRRISTAPTGTGVNPAFSSTLLRDPNRGVCERCHNK